MEAFLIYVAKVSCVITIFWMAYHLFLNKETFFKFNRYFLSAGLLIAITLPFIPFITYSEIEPMLYTTMEQNSSPNELANALNPDNVPWVSVFFIVYVIGIVFFGTKFIVQLFSLFKVVHNSSITKFGGFRYVESSLNIAPFSFFNYIFYNPSLYSESELSVILKHEAVHSSQGHSIDVLLGHLITITTWFNPFSWLYQSGIKQNLEFLADARAIQDVSSAKGYQYTLLKVSGNKFCRPIVNTFYNSLIKKRIVMLNKSKSNRMNVLKTALVLPALAMFIVSFNTVEVFIPMNSDSQTTWTYENPAETVRIIIDKNTTDNELEEMKRDLAEKDVDFSYTVVHNNNKEITSISINLVAKNKGSQINSSSSFSNENMPIDPILIVYDVATNSLSMGNAKNMKMRVQEDDNHNVWVHSDDDNESHKIVEIIEDKGKEVIKVNGKEVSREDYEAMKEDDGVHKKHIRIKKSKGDGHNNVFILKDSDNDDKDIIKTEEGDGFFFIDTDGDEKTLYQIDGKKSTQEEVKYLNPSDIESINVFKGERAEKKYGKKGKHGVVEITTKKKKN